jgi:hypothetical protein
VKDLAEQVLINPDIPLEEKTQTLERIKLITQHNTSSRRGEYF